MTLAYNFVFVCVWGSVVLAIPGSIACVVWAVIDNRYGIEIGIPLAVAALVYTIVMRTHRMRVLVRAGTWPGLDLREYYPRNEAELLAACKDCMRRYERPPSVVGAGWAHFLWRDGARGPRMFLHKFKGTVEGKPHARERERLLDTEQRWRSGTTINKINNYLETLQYEGDDVPKGPRGFPVKVKGYALSTHPTMDYISLGSWFACGNHGNGGENAKGSSKTMDTARVLNMRTGDISEWNYQTLRRRFDSKDRNDFCIIDVSFKNLLPNFMLQKHALEVDSPTSAAEWLSSKDAGKGPSYLRVLFQGGSRNYSLGLRWMDVYEETDHVDPHCCSVMRTWVQVDACSVWLGWREPLRMFRGKAYYRDANRWVPLLLPVMETYVVLRGYRNFEVIFKPGATVSGIYLDRLTRLLRKLHRQIGGRSEVRYGSPSADQVIFLDCVFTNSFNRVFEMLSAELSVKAVALHPGKHHPSTAPCARVHLASMYGFTNGKLLLHDLDTMMIL